MEERWHLEVQEILARHGHPATGLAYLGAGAQSRCYGTPDVAVLLEQAPDEGSGYPVLAWLTARAVEAGVRTPAVLAVGDHPRPYAVMQRAHGVHAGTHPAVAVDAEDWFRQLGEEVRKTNRVETKGFGPFVPDGAGGFRGRFGSWSDYLDDWLATHLRVGWSGAGDREALDLFLAQGIVTEQDFALVTAKVREASQWPVGSVLTHYDNRLDNLVVDDGRITLLDWGLSFAGVGIAQEMIKLFESGSMSMENSRVAAFLHGYGLSEPECLQAIEDGKLMLVLDGLAMSHGWVGDPDRLEGIRAWLRTVRRICAAW